ncbi:hypothetical protein [Roseateles sp. BYS78W]|uniref:hypothetical protein n=1 Tax=Pelomonas candidula TaxID=3299025 RepID=UPI0037483C18
MHLHDEAAMAGRCGDDPLLATRLARPADPPGLVANLDRELLFPPARGRLHCNQPCAAMPRLHAASNASLDCRLTPWDERVFGVPCAEITGLDGHDDETQILALLQQFDTWARENGVRFAYARVAPEAAAKRAFHRAGFYFAEASYRVGHRHIQGSAVFDRLIRRGPVLEPAVVADHAALQQILADDFEHGRIHEDPWVTREQAALRYRNWLHDLIEQGHELLCYRLKGEVIGLHVQRADEGRVDLVLTGVKRSHALLGASLWAEVLRLNRLRGVREAHTLISAANIPILNLYRRLDFQFDALLVGFHKRYE